MHRKLQFPPAETLGTLMTIPEVQSELRVGITTVYRLIADNRLTKVKIGTATRITRESFEQLIAEASKAEA